MRPGVKSIAETHPQLASEWADERNIETISSGSGYKARWECKEKHLFISKVANRTTGRGCPYCSGNKILRGYNDLATKYPSLVSEWDDERDIFTISPGSHKSFNWKCPEGHRYDAKAQDRTARNTGCPYCAGRKVLRGFNDIVTTHPRIMKEYIDKRSPYELSKGSHYVAEWECQEGHKWKKFVYKRAAGEGCPYCANRRVVIGFNNFTEEYPYLATEWDDPVDMMTLTAMSAYRAKWKCASGHSWRAPVHQRTKGSGCPYCSGRIVVKGINDLSSLRPELVSEWADEREMSTVSLSSRYRARWECKEGHTWSTSVFMRTRSFGTGCPRCAKQISKQEDDLSEYIQRLIDEDTCLVRNTRKVISPKELDIYLPDLNMAFEFNGNYWHSDSMLMKTLGMTAKDVHLRKLDLCSQQGIDLFFVWEDDWLSQRDVVEQAVFDAVVNKKRDSPLLSILSKS